VTTIADRTLVGFDVATGVEGFRTSLGAEPRGLAIAPDGSRVVVASLATGTLEQIGLANRREVRRVALPTSAEARARGAFTVAFVGTMAVAPFQQEIPVAKFASDSGHYGGSFTPPISHELAFFAPDGREAFGITDVNEPRALAWDAKRDVLYLVGAASDDLVSIKRASQIDVAAGVAHGLKQRCGADGVALAPDGGVLVWCSFTRSVARFDLDNKNTLANVANGPTLTASKLDAERHAGMVMFHTATSRLSGFGAMSCGNCHLDGRSDGLSWKIGKHELQTPMIAGRMAGTGPFKWDGGAKDLQKSLRETIGRLGGSGLTKKEIASLAAFAEGMPAIRTPTRTPEAVARGKQVFDSEEAGCRSCHDGPKYTDREQHDFVGAKGSFDTPSLLGLAATAPYFHDGSAATLESVLRDRGRIHGMAPGTTKLSDRDLTDLVAFLESL
jgi:mono/diheme cytochrome c family protein